MRRFNIEPDAINGATAILTGSEAHHLRNVLRLKPGNRITLFDGSGATYEGEITCIAPESTTVSIDKINPPDRKRPKLHLGQALIVAKKMDLIIQKATEIGVDSVTPFTSIFCSTNIPSPHKQERWQRIALESCKQCNRPTPPRINSVTAIESCFELAAGNDLKIIFWEEKADLTIRDIESRIPAENPESVFFMIGPEGGLADAEIDLAKQYGFLSVTLGRQILRAETASLVGGTLLQYLLGNLE